jgi:hypothetical protein
MYPENPQEDTAAAEDFLDKTLGLTFSGWVWEITD